MLGFHSTYIKKLYSSIFETNSLSPINPTVSAIVAPVINIEPEVIFRDASSATTIYTTPSDKDFYLTEAVISSCTLTGATGTYDTITVVDESGITRTIRNTSGSFGLSDGVGGMRITFGKRGLKLQRNSAISSTVSTTRAAFHIVGYIGSDRS